MDKGLRRIITKLIQQGVDPPERILDHLEKLDDPKKILRSRALLEVLLEIYEEETLNKSKGGKKMGDVYKLTCRKCEKKGLSQPPHFLEVVTEITEVTVEGKYIRQQEGRLGYYQCPQCNAKARWEVPQGCAKPVRFPSKKVL